MGLFWERGVSPMPFTFYDFPPLRGYWNLSPIIRFETIDPEPFVTKQSWGIGA
jgi:hypothetical protein